MDILCDAANLVCEDENTSKNVQYPTLLWQESPKTLDKSMDDLFNGVQHVYDKTKCDKKCVDVSPFIGANEKKKSILIDDSLFLSSPPIVKEAASLVEPSKVTVVDKKDNYSFNFEMLSNMPCPPSVSNVVTYSPEIETPLEEAVRTMDDNRPQDADVLERTIKLTCLLFVYLFSSTRR